MPNLFLGSFIKPAASNGGKTFAAIVKGDDETIASDSTLSDDTDLKAVLNINKEYSFIMNLFFTSDATPDFKYTFSLPAGASGVIWDGISPLINTPSVTLTDITSTRVNLFPSTAELTILLCGKVTMGATAGSMIFQWAQNTSDAANTTVNKGTFLTIWEEADA